jgi:DNA-directed RNA polymerase sigma subunit (sigma70/sigma32)
MTIGPAPAVRSPARNRAAPDPLSAYLTRISRGSLLTRKEEIELGRRVRAGDRLARRTLIEKNLRLIVSVTVRYRGSGVPLDDLIQEDNVGLIEAVERFDPERGHRFASYAVWRHTQGGSESGGRPVSAHQGAALREGQAWGPAPHARRAPRAARA